MNSMLRTPDRRATIQVPVGKLLIGSANKVRVQSMTNTDTRDGAATLRRSALEEAGCELVRVTIPDERAPPTSRSSCAGWACPSSRTSTSTTAWRWPPSPPGAQGAHQPGNIGSEKKVAEVMTAARDRAAPCASA
jgi:(E)-4-hydroxy-3-methylbut-2-enyl-diphosphate synthase